MTDKFAERFWAKVEKTEHCWIWTASTANGGYGQVNVNKKNRVAHRVAYELTVGPIPPGLELDHICRVRTCVNPSHLRPVTKKQNMENLSGARRDSASGIRGVFWHKSMNKWTARVGHNKKVISVGYFDDIAEAEKAVIAKRLELHTHNETDKLRKTA